MRWNGTIGAVGTLIVVLIVVTILSLTKSISADATENMLSGIITTVLGGGAVAVGTKVGHENASRTNGRDVSGQADRQAESKVDSKAESETPTVPEVAI